MSHKSLCEIPKSVYVHVPFCAHRCGYCDFTLVAKQDNLIPRYLRALKSELEAGPNVPPLSTLFFGGGTPTHLAGKNLEQLLTTVLDKYPLVTNAEFSVEANPLDLSDETLAILGHFGVNRISLGVQSFNAADLAVLERTHLPNELGGIIERVKNVIPNISFDLIFGVPGQTLESWEATLRTALAFQPTHLSTYGLTFEAGTAFFQRRSAGALTQAPEELEREMFTLAMDLVPQAGLEHYELSSFARPGFECAHNHVYWSGDPYLAYGPGASRLVDGRRETNTRSVHGYLAKLEAGQLPAGESEQLDPTARAHELLYVGLRRRKGVSRSDFATRTGFILDDLVGQPLAKLVVQGLVADDGERVWLTREGCFLADRVSIDLL